MISLTCCFVFLPSLVTPPAPAIHAAMGWEGDPKILMPSTRAWSCLMSQTSSHPVQRTGRESGPEGGDQQEARDGGLSSFNLCGICAPQGETNFP